MFAFTAPWNIVYTPKLLDPFTGHEAKGEYVEEYIKLFQKQSYERFKPLIGRYNELMNELFPIDLVLEIINSMNLDDALRRKFTKAVQEEFLPIVIS